jgi:hypothetical protein
MTGYEIIGRVGILILFANFAYLMGEISKEARRS